MKVETESSQESILARQSDQSHTTCNTRTETNSLAHSIHLNIKSGGAETTRIARVVSNDRYLKCVEACNLKRLQYTRQRSSVIFAQPRKPKKTHTHQTLKEAHRARTKTHAPLVVVGTTFHNNFTAANETNRLRAVSQPPLRKHLRRRRTPQNVSLKRPEMTQTQFGSIEEIF